MNASSRTLVNILKYDCLHKGIQLCRPFGLLSTNHPQHESTKHFSLNHSKILYVLPKLETSFAPKLEKKLRKAYAGEELDKDDKGRIVIYRGALTKKLFAVKVFSLNTSVMGIGMQYVILQKFSDSIIVFASTSVLVGMFTFLTPFLINMLASTYVTEMLYEKDLDRYTAIRYNFFLQRKELQFQIKDVVVPELPGPLSTVDVVKNGKKSKLFFVQETFEDPIHYGKLMGFDKPIDFHLDVDYKEKLDDLSKPEQNSKS